MDKAVKVAVVRSDNRRGAVAEALALVADDIRACVTPDVLIKPNLVSHRVQLPSTHADTLSAALDAVLSAGAKQVTIAEGASDATAGFAQFGYHRETYGRPVRFVDLNRDETEWRSLELVGVDGSTRVARLSETIAGATCRVSLALAKTHVNAIVTLSLKNMLSSVHKSDRIMMHGYAGGGNGYQGWKKPIIEFLKGDNLAVNWLTRLMGRVKNVRSSLKSILGKDSYESLSPADLNFLKSLGAMNRNLVALNRQVKPHISVVDGFQAMHREGPRHGTPCKLGTVIAGTDAVAVDAVAAAIMGYHPQDIGYLHYAGQAGLGVVDLDAITIVGDPIEKVRRKLVPHSNYIVQRHWKSLTAPIYRGPHAAAVVAEGVAHS